jgi:uncharacterized protein involved in type VI secretion and phage assembly
MRKLFTICVLLALSAAASAAEEKRLYSWTDDEGNVHYSDKVPANAAEQNKTVLNDQGIAVGEIEGKKTAEQLAQERIEKEQAVAQKLQQRADQALLATYLSVPELEMHRDRRVELFQAQARVTELYLKNLHRRLDSLRKEASKYQPYSDDTSAPMIAPDLADDLQKTKETIARHVRNLQKYESDEREIIERFNNDIERFKILKGINEQTALASP